MKKTMSLNDYSVSFWTYHKNKQLKISLKLGETKTLHVSGWHDEGYLSEYEVYSLYEVDGVLSVTYETHYYNSDCDGKHEHHSESICPVNDLHGGRYFRAYTKRGCFRKCLPKRLPLWRKLNSHQRDFVAESMNY